VSIKPGVWIEPSRFFQQISDAGYAARKDDVRLTLTGTLVKEGDRLLLRVEDVKPGPQEFLLLPGKSKDEKEASAFAEAFQEASEKVGKTVELEGVWKPADKKDKTALPTLTLRRVAEIKPNENERK
jgi:hypothetical protein